MKSVSFTGIGCERDTALRGGYRQNIRTWNDGIPRERKLFPLGLGDGVRHSDLLSGDLVSLCAGKVIPLDAARGFAGIIEKVGEDRGQYVASVVTRGALVVKLQGLSADTRQGEKVYAIPGRPSELFTLEEGAGVLVGELLAIENLQTGRAIVGIRTSEDTRPFWLGGPRPDRHRV